MSKKKKQFAVVGLGRFGGSVCKELFEMGHEVLAVDKEEEKVNEYAKFATHAVQLDSTDEQSLKSIGIGNFDHVVVAIGDNIQASILTTLVLKEMGIEKVWAKAQNSYHQKVLDKIGADLVVHPEFDMGKRIAHNMSSEKIIDFIDLSDDYSIVELLASKKVSKQTLIELNVRAKYGVTILAIKRGEAMNIAPLPDDIVRENDILIVMGHKNDLDRFEDEGL
ncbi:MULTISPECIES: potassium channel family protein [Alteribacter]|uniref:TrkA family potassium uptake protein n=1 Tax=Alteribacter keqinensis TaxID=2483800 RepID=A0A3M7TWR3_9BACI|nr:MULTISPECIES: TrkA family potassium uptake protein [Alteribacter]MBM7096130.1 TrkA family potassium uptake protein [Alteribacter salitolerans]RNA69933.1 TrkA family potassium uptake protein [Alteribacter keqinensis]